MPTHLSQVKNVTTNAMGDRVGRLYLEKQDMATMNVKKMKGLKRAAAGKESGAKRNKAGNE